MQVLCTLQWNYAITPSFFAPIAIQESGYDKKLSVSPRECADNPYQKVVACKDSLHLFPMVDVCSLHIASHWSEVSCQLWGRPPGSGPFKQAWQKVAPWTWSAPSQEKSIGPASRNNHRPSSLPHWFITLSSQEQRVIASNCAESVQLGTGSSETI